MTIIHRSALVPYSSTKMYQLVDDIAAYPEFLPWCRNAIVHAREPNFVEATLTLAKGGLHKSFTTRNYLQPNKMIEMRLINGPFKHLHGFWRFESLQENACNVLFDLEFEFINKPVAMLVGTIFQQMANSLVDSFCQRARDLYGQGS